MELRPGLHAPGNEQICESDFGGVAGGEFWGELADEEFLKNIEDSVFANLDGRILEDQTCSIAIIAGIVEIGDCACAEASEDVGVVRLPVAVITLANHGIGQRIEEA